MKTGIELIIEERQRQIVKEGWTAEHDEQHLEGQLALVASLYATPIPLFARVEKDGGGIEIYDPWPWHDGIECTRYGDGTTYKVNAWDKRKKHNTMRKLIIAGALIAAEIDRLQRQSKSNISI